jgi:hypothetical protein
MQPSFTPAPGAHLAENISRLAHEVVTSRGQHLLWAGLYFLAEASVPGPDCQGYAALVKRLHARLEPLGQIAFNVAQGADKAAAEKVFDLALKYAGSLVPGREFVKAHERGLVNGCLSPLAKAAIVLDNAARVEGLLLILKNLHARLVDPGDSFPQAGVYAAPILAALKAGKSATAYALFDLGECYEGKVAVLQSLCSKIHLFSDPTLLKVLQCWAVETRAKLKLDLDQGAFLGRERFLALDADLASLTNVYKLRQGLEVRLLDPDIAVCAKHLSYEFGAGVAAVVVKGDAAHAMALMQGFFAGLKEYKQDWSNLGCMCQALIDQKQQAAAALLARFLVVVDDAQLMMRFALKLAEQAAPALWQPLLQRALKRFSQEPQYLSKLSEFLPLTQEISQISGRAACLELMGKYVPKDLKGRADCLGAATLGYHAAMCGKIALALQLEGKIPAIAFEAKRIIMPELALALARSGRLTDAHACFAQAEMYVRSYIQIMRHARENDPSGTMPFGIREGEHDGSINLCIPPEYDGDGARLQVWGLAEFAHLAARFDLAGQDFAHKFSLCLHEIWRAVGQSRPALQAQAYLLLAGEFAANLKRLNGFV